MATDSDSRRTEVDVLIVGGGISGIGTAWRLQEQCPELSFAIVESRQRLGGTWDLFRYPGVRSDSDMFTFSYPFRPWQGERLQAQGQAIQDYIEDTAEQADLGDRIDFETTVIGAEWSSRDARWTVHTVAGTEREPATYHCRVLSICTGYFNYEHGYEPQFDGADDFSGVIVHPQHWPTDLDYTGKRIAVIGSGATAVTLVPALATTAEHVTMIQRSPSYIVDRPATDPVARVARTVLPESAAHQLLRIKNVAVSQGFYRLARHRPELTKSLLRKGLQRHLSDEQIDTDFTPSYNPWDQRLCVAPDGDFFDALTSGTASVETGSIETFTSDGIQLSTGEHIEADIIVTATGLDLSVLGGITFTVDDEPVSLGRQFVWQGAMVSGLPNLVFTVGYANASWTLRADLIAQLTCRLLQWMTTQGIASVMPEAPHDVQRLPLLNLTAGYLLRSRGMPMAGDSGPWRPSTSYLSDLLRRRQLDFTEQTRIVRLTKDSDVGAA